MYKVILTALQTFRSVVDHKTIHSKGDSVVTTDVKRVNSLVSRGLAEITAIEDVTEAVVDDEENGNAAGTVIDPEHDPAKVAFNGNDYEPQTVKEALVAIGVTCAPSIGVNGLTKKLEGLTEDQQTALAEKLVNE